MNEELREEHLRRITDEKARAVYDFLCEACEKRPGGNGMEDADQMLVADYCYAEQLKGMLQADIAERGILIFDARRGLDVENCSISARVRVSAQMDRLYKALGFQELAQRNQAPDGDDDDL